MAPLVAIKEMDSGGLAARDKGPTSTRDKSGSALCYLEGDTQFLGYGEEFECTQVISETQTMETQHSSSTAGAGSGLIPDESSLIPIPDLGKVIVFVGGGVYKINVL